MHSSTAHEVTALRSFGTGWPKFAARLMPPKAAVRTVDSSGVKTYELSLDHRAVFGTGVHLPALMKIKLCQIANRIKEVWGHRRQLTRPANVLPSEWWRRQFQVLTGISHRRVREIEQEARLNGNLVFDPINRGQKPRRLELEIEELRNYIEMKVIQHREGRGLTGPTLCGYLQQDYNLTPSEVPVKQVHRALRQLGFRYSERDAQMISYRNAAETQADLRAFCRWVVSGTVKLDDWPDSGKPRFAWKPKFPVCYTDASWVVPSMISKKGYYNRVTRGLDLCRVKGKGLRIVLLDAIFSTEEKWGEESCRVQWHTQTPAKNGRLFFKNHTADTFCAYFTEYIVPVFQEIQQLHLDPDGLGICYLILDNASVHRSFKESLKGKTLEELIDWVTELGGDEAAKFNTEYNASPTKDIKFVRSYIQRNALRVLRLEELAAPFNIVIKFTPKYHPECNAIEKIWMLVKNEFRRTDPNLNWKTRLNLAYSKVTSRHVDKFISESIHWCHVKHAAFEHAAAEAAAPAAAPAAAAAAAAGAGLPPVGPMVVDGGEDDSESDSEDGEQSEPQIDPFDQGGDGAEEFDWGSDTEDGEEI